MKRQVSFKTYREMQIFHAGVMIANAKDVIASNAFFLNGLFVLEIQTPNASPDEPLEKQNTIDELLPGTEYLA